MKEYHKIETVFNRDVDGTKKLIDGSYRSETVEMLKDVNWIWTEKVDGTNVRIFWDGHKVAFGGRTDRAQIPVDLMNFLNEKFATNETEELFEQKFGDCEVTLYGEGYGKKIQKVGGLYRDNVSFILFDVTVGNTWLKRDSVEDIATAFGVDAVPIVGVGSIEKAVEFVKQSPMSALSDKAPMEGVVARPECEVFDRMGRRVIVKIKVCDFKE
jgi:ATP-dependent RNA circularization protein (DNA/RNA ligase family)